MAISPGDRFGRLLAVERAGPKTWRFLCDCGVQKAIIASNVSRGLSQSCGCLRREISASRSSTHGQTVGGKTSRTFKSWSAAKARCNNPNDKSYRNYGARGIRMRASWADSFSTFLEEMGECPQGMTLDRIDTSLGYEKGNCRWADRVTQSRNRRNVHWVDYRGEKRTISDVGDIEGVDYQKAYHWVTRRGWTLEAAIDYLKSGPSLYARPVGRRR